MEAPHTASTENENDNSTMSSDQRTNVSNIPHNDPVTAERSDVKDSNVTPMTSPISISNQKQRSSTINRAAANIDPEPIRVNDSTNMSKVNIYLKDTMASLNGETDVSLDSYKAKSEDLIELIKKSSALTKIKPFDWNNLEKAYEHIFSEYINEMEGVIGDFNELIKERQVWQEVAFTMDRERSTDRINQIEQWISTKESNLDSVKSELKNSIDMIQKLFGQFDASTLVGSTSSKN